MARFGRHAAVSLLWMFAQTLLARGTGFLSQLALAALLSPTDFGAIGLTYSVTTISSVFTSFGLEDIVIQRGHRSHIWIGPAFWISLTVGTVSGLVTLVAAPVAAIAYQMPELTGLICVVAISMPVGAATTVPGLLLRANMSFRFLALYGMAEIILQALMTILLAWLGFGPYSFVIPVPVVAVIKAVIWWGIIREPYRLKPHVRRWRYLLGNTSKVFVTNALLTLVAQGGYVVLGFLVSPEAVGAYYFGYRLAAQPLWSFAGNLSNVLFPVFVRIKDDLTRQARAALDVSYLLAFSVIGLAFLQVSVARPFMILLFGTKWVAAIPVVQLLSVGLGIDAVSWISGSLLKARGQYGIFFSTTAITTPIFFVFVTAGAWLNGIVGLSYGVLVFYGVTQPFVVYAAYKGLGLTFRDVLSIYSRPLVYGCVASVTAYLISETFGLDQRPILQVIVNSFVVCSIYLLLIRTFSDQYWHTSLNSLRRFVARKAPEPSSA